MKAGDYTRFRDEVGKYIGEAKKAWGAAIQVPNNKGIINMIKGFQAMYNKRMSGFRLPYEDPIFEETLGMLKEAGEADWGDRKEFFSRVYRPYNEHFLNLKNLVPPEGS